MDRDDRRGLLAERFKIELSDKELEGLEEMTTLDQDKRDYMQYLVNEEVKRIVDEQMKGLKEEFEEKFEAELEERFEAELEERLEAEKANERKKHIDSLTDILLALRKEGETVDQLLSRIPIPNEDRLEVESAIKRRLS